MLSRLIQSKHFTRLPIRKIHFSTSLLARGNRNDVKEKFKADEKASTEKSESDSTFAENLRKKRKIIEEKNKRLNEKTSKLTEWNEKIRKQNENQKTTNKGH